MIKLTLTEKGGEPKVLTFDKDEITIGRVSGNDIVLAKGNISKRHTRLTKRDNGMEIADLKSTNGTYVNGRKIAGPTAVAPSDRIYVGDFLIGLDGPGAGMAEPADCTAPRADCMARRPRPARRAGCRSRRRPRRPRAADSSASRLPDEDETSSSGEDEEEAGLAARPPRAGRAIPPPPPPPPPPARRQPTPLASRSLGLDDDDAYGGAPAETQPGPGRHRQRRPVSAHTPRRRRRRRRLAAHPDRQPARPGGRRRGGRGGAGFRRRDGTGRSSRAWTRPAVPPPVWRRCSRIPR